LLLRQTVDFARPVGVNDGGISLSYQERLGETVADSTQKQTLMTDRQNVAAARSRGSFFKSPRNGPTWRAAVANIQSGDPLRRRCPRHARKVDLKSARRPHRSDGRVVAARACRQTRSPVPLRSAKTIGAVPGSAYKRPGWLPLLFIPNKRPGGTHMSIDGSREKRWFEMDCSLEGGVFELAVPRRFYSPRKRPRVGAVLGRLIRNQLAENIARL
jgi:hypothetical protein